MWQEKIKRRFSFYCCRTWRYYPGLSVEITDSDVDVLGIKGNEDTMILNIVTLSSEQSGVISLNLVGPIIIIESL